MKTKASSVLTLPDVSLAHGTDTHLLNEQMIVPVNSCDDDTVSLLSARLRAGPFTVMPQVEAWEWGIHASAPQRRRPGLWEERLTCPGSHSAGALARSL